MPWLKACGPRRGPGNRWLRERSSDGQTREGNLKKCRHGPGAGPRERESAEGGGTPMRPFTLHVGTEPEDCGRDRETR